MTIEQAETKLNKLLSVDNPTSPAFHLGRVGFRKHTKKYLQSIDKSIERALEIGRLREFIEHEKSKLDAKQPKQNKYYETPNQLVKGDKYYDSSFGLVTVIKINKSTVTIQTESGYKEARLPSLILINHIK